MHATCEQPRLQLKPAAAAPTHIPQRNCTLHYSQAAGSRQQCIGAAASKRLRDVPTSTRAAAAAVHCSLNKTAASVYKTTACPATCSLLGAGPPAAGLLLLGG
jgi:hypothetical protein